MELVINVTSRNDVENGIEMLKTILSKFEVKSEKQEIKTEPAKQVEASTEYGEAKPTYESYITDTNEFTAKVISYKTYLQNEAIKQVINDLGFNKLSEVVNPEDRIKLLENLDKEVQKR